MNDLLDQIEAALRERIEQDLRLAHLEHILAPMIHDVLETLKEPQ